MVTFCAHAMSDSGLCVGVYDEILQLRACNERSLLQRWSLLHEKGAQDVRAEEATLNLQRAYNASLVCELGTVVFEWLA